MNLETSYPQKLLLPILRRVLRPIVHFALARRVPIQVLSELLKKLYLQVSIEEFSLPKKRLTDSRISVLTGLQRKDIKAIRADTDEDTVLSTKAGPLPRLVSHWCNSAGYQDKSGAPLLLPKTGPGPSFDALVKMISHDIHPRTMLDDLLALDLVTADANQISLIANAFIPRADEDALLGYLANNLGDHVTAAVANVLAAPAAAPHFERAVHYNQLSRNSLDELEALSRRLQQQTLEQINAKALTLQIKDTDDPAAKGRFRCGAFVFTESLDDPATKEHTQ